MSTEVEHYLPSWWSCGRVAARRSVSCCRMNGGTVDTEWALACILHSCLKLQLMFRRHTV